MVTFYYKPSSEAGERIREVLKEQVLAYKPVCVEPDKGRPEGLPEGMEPPVLIDGEEIFQGREAILRHLEKMKAFGAEWYKFQSDACYCDIEGNVE